MKEDVGLIHSERRLPIPKTVRRGWRYLGIAALFVLPEAGLVFGQTTVVVKEPTTVVVATPAPAYGAYGPASYAGSVRRQSRRVARRTSRRVAHRH